MTAYAHIDQLTFAPDTDDVVDDPATLAPDDVDALVDEMAGLARGLFMLLGNTLGGTLPQAAPAGSEPAPETIGLPVEPHPAGPVDLPVEPAAPVLQSVEMPATVPTVAAVPPASVPMPEPVAETVSVPMPTVAMPAVPLRSVPMPDVAPTASPISVQRTRTNPALAAALLDEISFLDD